jgi:hypothetical protein
VTVQQEAIWTLVLPEATVGPGAVDWPRRWALSRIMDRGGHRQLPVKGAYDVIGWSVTGHVSPTTTWAPAPVCWVADFSGDPPLGAIRIDPVHLAAGPRGLTLVPAEQLDVNPAEAGRLLGAVAESVRPKAVGVRLGAPDRWYMTAAHAPDAPWWTPQQVAARDLLDCLPSGDESIDLKRILNEIQVILHHQPDNARRREQGRPEINSVWPWGWAYRPLLRVGSVVTRVYGDHPYAVGLARLAGIEVLEPFEVEKEMSSAAVVIPAGRHGSDPEWLERTWCRPLLKSLARGRISGVRIVTEAGRVFEIDARDRRKFWRGSRRGSG